MNKKASFDTVVNLFRLLFVVMAFFSVVLLAKITVKEKIDVFEVQSRLLTNRLVFSKDINYFDTDISRLYIGTVDLQKFNSGDIENNLLNSIYYGKINSEAAAKLTLKDMESQQSHQVFYNKGLYDEKEVLLKAKLIGKGSAKRMDRNFYVLIKDNDKIKRGILNVDVILPNQ